MMSPNKYQAAGAFESRFDFPHARWHISGAFYKIMKDNSFENAMSKIVGQHEAEVRAEARATKRSQVYGQIRGVVVFLLAAAALVVAYNFRAELKDKLLPKHAAVAAEVIVTTNADGTVTTVTNSSTPEGKTVNIVNTAQQNAATRDAIIDQIAK